MKKKLRILLVDDDEVDRMVLRRYIIKSSIDATIFEATTGSKCLDLIQQESYDLIFLDYLLPDKSGTSLIEEIVAKKDTPIILITSQTDDIIAAEIIKSGATDYLSKSAFNVESISQSIRNALQISEEKIKRKNLESQLIDSKEIAEKSARAKQDFLANMSHEIRTPMNAIIGFTDLLLKSELSEEQRDNTNAIKQASENLLVIVNDILDFSKIEAGKMNIEKYSFQLSEVLDSVMDLFLSKSKEKGIELEINISNKIPKYLKGDAVRLNQILVNLVGNAVKFTSQGRITLSVDLLDKPIENKMLLTFKVKDTGIGIPKSKLKDIFESFNQAIHTQVDNYGGTGLGLTISKRLVELQKGTISVESKVGAGTTFLVKIPYEIGKLNSKKEPKNNKESELITPKINILICEDNRMNQLLAKKVFSEWDIIPDIAEDGLIGVKMLKENNYDLILMDLNMPRMDGIEATIAIRSLTDSSKSQIPIIAMTAHALPEQKQKCLDAGMDDYLSKPFKTEDLIKKINGVIGKMPISSLPKTSNLISSRKHIFDFSNLQELGGGDISFVREMIDVFLEDAPNDLMQLNEAMQQQSFDNIRKVAHKMKSSLGLLNIKSAHFLAEKIQLIDDQLSINELQNMINEFNSLCQKAITELKSVEL